MLSNIFNSIKNEELPLLTQEVLDEKNRAIQNEQINDSAYIYAKINLAKNCVNTIYKKILQKLKTDKLNHFIKKNSKVFLKFIEELNDEVFEIITTDTANENSEEENDFWDKAYKDSLIELKSEITAQWNNEAIIQGHIKKHERYKQFGNYIISFLIALMVAVITGIVFNRNSMNTKPVQKIVQKEITPSFIIEKVQSSPEAKKEASYFYELFKKMDNEQLKKLLKTLYLKLHS